MPDQRNWKNDTPKVFLLKRRMSGIYRVAFQSLFSQFLPMLIIIGKLSAKHFVFSQNRCKPMPKRRSTCSLRMEKCHKRCLRPALSGYAFIPKNRHWITLLSVIVARKHFQTGLLIPSSERASVVDRQMSYRAKSQEKPPIV